MKKLFIVLTTIFSSLLTLNLVSFAEDEKQEPKQEVKVIYKPQEEIEKDIQAQKEKEAQEAKRKRRKQK